MNQTISRIGKGLVGCATMAALLVAGPAWAIPAQLSVQGQLTNQQGDPAEGSFTITFRLYQASTGGLPIWTETQPSVQTFNGIFDTHIGADILNPLLPALFLDNPQVWLGVKVEAGSGVPPGGDPELPQTPGPPSQDRVEANVQTARAAGVDYAARSGSAGSVLRIVQPLG